jgi:hypothetical protein
VTAGELRKKFERGRSLILKERRWRNHVFRGKPDERDAKVAEMDELMAILVEFKNIAKVHVGEDVEQPALLDVPAKGGYN